MIFISILILIVAKALPSLNKKISSIHFTRIVAIIFIYTGALTFNCFDIQSIGSGIGIYSGLFHVTQIVQLIEIFLFTIGGLILIGWGLPQVTTNSSVSYTGASTDKVEEANSLSLYPSSTTRSFTGVRLGQGQIGNKYSVDYSLIVLFSSLGSSLLISSFDLISLYLSIELQSFGLYVLSTLYRDSESSTSAGLKYFLLGGLSSCLILLGSGLIYSYTGLTNFESLYLLNSISDIDQQYIIQGLSLGLTIVFIGFLFKIAAAPLHNWSPDVYDEVPTIVTIWLTIIPKLAILILLLELYTQIGIIGGIKSFLSLSDSSSLLPYINNSLMGLPVLKNLLLISSILSLIVGSLLGLAQIRIKRLLAYSTISHIGFLLLALAINTEQSIDSFLFYLIQYTITNLNVFLILLALTYIINKRAFIKEANLNTTIITRSPSGLRGGNGPNEIFDIKYISELKGLFFSNPLLSLGLGICLFSMAGIPPLIGFFSKQFVLYSALESGYYFISIIAIIVSVISASYYLKIIKVLHQEQEEVTTSNKNKSEFSTNLSLLAVRVGQEGEMSNKQGVNINPTQGFETEINLSNFHSYLISILTLIILLFFIKPSIILNSTQLLSLSLFYN